MNIFEFNAAKLRELHDDINAKFLRRNEGKTQWAAWQNAAATFHASFERLAFPGGLSDAVSLLKKGDEQTIEMAVRYLENNPFYFRSGYIKTEIIQYLKKALLREDQRGRLQEVVLARIRDKETPREFRRYGQLAIHIADPDFERRISEEARTSSRSMRSRHAKWILEQIKSSRAGKSRSKRSASVRSGDRS